MTRSMYFKCLYLGCPERFTEQKQMLFIHFFQSHPELFHLSSWQPGQLKPSIHPIHPPVRQLPPLECSKPAMISLPIKPSLTRPPGSIGQVQQISSHYQAHFSLQKTSHNGEDGEEDDIDIDRWTFSNFWPHSTTSTSMTMKKKYYVSSLISVPGGPNIHGLEPTSSPTIGIEAFAIAFKKIKTTAK